MCRKKQSKYLINLAVLTMDFDSPDVMKDFPGLYSSELRRKCSDSDYKDENEKTTKKDMLIGKRKDKKDKKDKEKGYAALEGESSDEASACKSKKSKSFKFTKSKDKEKREKEHADEKKEILKKGDKKLEKVKRKKGRKPKHSLEETIDIADALPIFGVNLDLAIERSRCHDGVDIPLPIRECIDYVEAMGLAFEGVYKISGPKTKVSQIRKMYNHRQMVKLSDYDVPTATSVLKMFLRDLPEPIFTNELIIRFEEAGAILNLNTREKHLKHLVDNLPSGNKLLLSWLIIHLRNVTLKEHLNKMNKQSIAAALNHTFHVSSRLLQALLHHSRVLFPHVAIFKYIPPLTSGAQLPEKPFLMESELKKQESLLSQIHSEMNFGCISKPREELLWEVQMIITQLKRKIKKVQLLREIDQANEKANLQNRQLEENTSGKLADENAVVNVAEESAALNVADECAAENINESPCDEIVKTFKFPCLTQVFRLRKVDIMKHCHVVRQVDSLSHMDNMKQVDSWTQVDNLTEVDSLAQGDNMTKVDISTQVNNLTSVDSLAQMDKNNMILTDTHHFQTETNQLYPLHENGEEEKINRSQEGKFIQEINEPEAPGPSNQDYNEEDDDEGDYSFASEETSTDSDILEKYLYFDERLITLRVKNTLLKELAEKLIDDISKQKKEIEDLQKRSRSTNIKQKKKYPKIPEAFEEIKNLLVKENQMLQIKKMNLVRQIIEQRELCVDLIARLKWASKDTKEQKFLQYKQIIKQSV